MRRNCWEPVAITGIGMITSVGTDRESVWQSVCAGRSGVRYLDGILSIPDGLLIGAPVPNWQPEIPHEAKVIGLMRIAAREALADAGLDWQAVPRERFGCAISGHMGDTGYLESHVYPYQRLEGQSRQWYEQFLPNSGCSLVANEHGLYGPRICHSTACASGMIDFLSAVRAVQDNQCDLALAGSSEAIHPLFAAGFRAMRVLAEHDDPQQACRPFDRGRNGFVMGEGAAMFVIERLSQALARGASIYAEVAAGRMMAEAHHVTGLDSESSGLARAIGATLADADLTPADVQYINAHGTGTQQNDLVESRGIRRAFGAAASDVWVSATKSMLGHLVNAASSVELAITALTLRDHFAPPTLNLTDPDPQCDLDCLPLVGRSGRLDHALKISVAFGGHLAVVALRRWTGAGARAAQPTRLAA